MSKIDIQLYKILDYLENMLTAYNIQSVSSNAVYNAMKGTVIKTSTIDLISEPLQLTDTATLKYIGAYQFGLIEIYNLTAPSGYHKEFIFSIQYFTSSSNRLTARLNNISTPRVGTWSGSTFRNVASTDTFKLSDIVLEPVLNYAGGNGINLYFENDGTGVAVIYHATITEMIVKD